MPASKRAKPLYQRGEYRLYPREGRNLEIVWYDAARRRERSTSAGTADIADGKAALDRLFVGQTKGEAFCPTCGQSRTEEGVFVTIAVANYMTLAETKSSAEAIRHRLAHVLAYLIETSQADVRCAAVDEQWISNFRAWLAARPIVAPSGAKRARALSTIENSVLQLAAAINRCGGVTARFKAQQTRELNATPTFRADLDQLAAMFRYCLYPDAPTPKAAERIVRDRTNLLSFLRVSVATLARPDAAHDVSTAPERRQWNPERAVLALNPAGRRQTKKYRAVIPVARQLVPVLKDCTGLLIPSVTVKGAWETMADHLKLPARGEAGMKLIRRSVATILRDRLPMDAWGEIEMFLGHDRFDDVSDLYAPFRPDYLRRALAAVEGIIDEIEAKVPGAYRTVTATGGKVVRLGVQNNV